jgi:hypothetical protein
VGVMGVVDPAAVKALVERTCREQGLPVSVTSAAVVSTVAALLESGAGVDGRQLEPPDRRYSIRVEAVAVSACRSDEDVVDKGLQDGSLPVEVERPPLAS